MLGRILRFVRRRATTLVVARGVRAGDGRWLGVGVAGLGLQLLSRWWRRPDAVERFVLQPGQRLEIDHLRSTFSELGRKPSS